MALSTPRSLMGRPRCRQDRLGSLRPFLRSGRRQGHRDSGYIAWGPGWNSGQCCPHHHREWSDVEVH